MRGVLNLSNGISRHSATIVTMILKVSFLPSRSSLSSRPSLLNDFVLHAVNKHIGQFDPSARVQRFVFIAHVVLTHQSAEFNIQIFGRALAAIPTLAVSASSDGVPVHSGCSTFTSLATASNTGSGGSRYSSVSVRAKLHICVLGSLVR